MQQPQVLEASGGLRLRLDSPSPWRIEWVEPDWLGPIGFRLHHAGTWYGTAAAASEARTLQPNLARVDGRDELGSYRGVTITWEPSPLPIIASARAYERLPVIVLRIETRAAVRDMATGAFEWPAVAWTFAPARRAAGGIAEGARSYGHQYTEFALPVTGDASCTGFLFAPHRPPVVEPLLLIAPDGRTLLLAPLDHFHEQIIAVPKDGDSAADGVRCGWHGDLREVPAGFATELVLWASPSPRAALDEWAGCLRRRHHTERPSRYADEGVGKLSYWTDNGAVYYYRTEPDCDYVTTLEHVVSDLAANRIPVRSLQIDSWFYPHQNLRPVSAEGAPIVPPSGMMKWEPRTDLFATGFDGLRRRAGGLPLTFHSRHFSSRSPYFQRFEAWTDGDYAHPADGRLYHLLLAQAAAWGAITYEQDWMVESFLGVRGLRELPGRARQWQEDLDRAAEEHGLTLQWCMPTPADLMQTVTLRHVTSVRTSGDYRYLFDNGLGWVWFLQTNALARALGLNPFKDVFITHGETTLSPGEPYAEAEALLASLSTGPVAIGDQIGCTNRDIVMRTCREDGVLIKPDVPLAAVDRCFGRNSFFERAPLIAETYSQHPAGRWIYVASFNANRSREPLRFRVCLDDLGELRPSGPVLAYDWRKRNWSRLDPGKPGAGWDCDLPFQDWDYRVLCPLLANDVTVFGDVSKYATVGDRRVAAISVAQRGVEMDVLGGAASRVEVHGHARSRPHEVTAWIPGETRTIPPRDDQAGDGEWWSWNPDDGHWTVRVAIGPMGWTRVSLTCV